MVELFLADIRKMADDPQKYVNMVDEKRREKALRFRFLEDRLRCAAGGLLIQKILGAKTEELVLGPYGKPAVEKGDKQFNLSHSGDYVVLATGSQPLGVDIERTRPFQTKERRQGVDWAVAERCFQKKEIDFLKSDSKQADERFYLLWTIKESVMKATGRGLGLDPKTFCVLPLNGAFVLEEKAWHFMQYWPDSSHIVSVCAMENDFTAEITETVF